MPYRFSFIFVFELSGSASRIGKIPEQNISKVFSVIDAFKFRTIYHFSPRFFSGLGLF
jgi:hypothetical protein